MTQHEGAGTLDSGTAVTEDSSDPSTPQAVVLDEGTTREAGTSVVTEPFEGGADSDISHPAATGGEAAGSSSSLRDGAGTGDGAAADAKAIADADEDKDSESGMHSDDEDDSACDGDGPRGRRARVGKDRLAQLEREGEVAADFLERLLDIADLDGDIDVDVDGDRAAVAIVDSDEGQVPRRLVGPDGRVLEALQDLTRLAVQSATGERSRLMLDVAGFRAKRRSTLVDEAHAAIEQVKASGSAQSLPPMTAFERKVVHDEVAAAGLVSESEGAEPSRYVVIHPA